MKEIESRKDPSTDKELYVDPPPSGVTHYSYSFSSLPPSLPPPSFQLRVEVESLKGQLERTNLSKSMAESKLSDFEREKMIIELEIKELIARHKTEVTEKMARAAHVSCGEFRVECVRVWGGLTCCSNYTNHFNISD